MGRYWHRGPSRILWFAIGAFAATWWIKRKDGERYSFGHCKRLPPQPYPPPESSAAQSAASGDNSWSFGDIPRKINNFPPADYPAALPEWARSRSNNNSDWLTEEEKARFANMSRQATEAVSIEIFTILHPL